MNSKNDDKINLIIQTYYELNKDRMEEYLLCIIENLNNPYVKKIYNLLEDDNSESLLPISVTQHPKYERSLLGNWITYKDAFDFCNEKLYGQFCGLINLDIMLDKESNWNEMIEHISLKQNNQMVFDQSRHEYDIKKNIKYLNKQFDKYYHAHTQDAWFFQCPLHVDDCNFQLGVMDCDNAIADRINKSGYFVLNKAIEYKIFHVHSHEIRVKVEQVKDKKIITQIAEQKAQGYKFVCNFDKVIHLSICQICKQFKVPKVDYQEFSKLNFNCLFEKYKKINDIVNNRLMLNNKA